MGERTGIEWCDHTFNPWIGCTRVSAACDSCYAETWAGRFFAGDGLWSGNRHRTSQSYRNQPFKWNRKARADGVRRGVFCLSLGDFADNQVPEEWRDELWETIAQCPDLDWRILTKRPQNYVKMLPKSCAVQLAGMDWPWPWVWLGTTVENQEEIDRRYRHLAETPAVSRWFSIEPLLGPMDIGVAIAAAPGRFDPPVDWVVVGGETGVNARPMHPEWVRSLRDQCSDVGVPFFFKQWGDWHPDALLMTDAITGACPPPNMRVGKEAAGRLLDGREWSEMPDAR